MFTSSSLPFPLPSFCSEKFPFQNASANLYGLNAETAQVEAVVEACSAQHGQLQFMAQRLPAFLPGSTTVQVPTNSCPADGASCADEADKASAGNENVPSNLPARPSSADNMGNKKKRATAPRRCTSPIITTQRCFTRAGRKCTCNP